MLQQTPIITSCLPKSLKCAQSDIEHAKVLAFRRKVYSQTYPSVEVAKNDPYYDQAYVVYSETEEGEVESTGTVIFDSEKGLPEDKYFYDAVAKYRKSGKKLVEIGRFVIEGRRVDLLQRYYKAIHDVAVANHVDIVLMVIRQKDVRFHQRMMGVDLLIHDIDEGFGSGYAFSCIAWDIAKTPRRFYNWVALVE